jgi:hypothetical protein
MLLMSYQPHAESFGQNHEFGNRTLVLGRTPTFGLR